MSWQLASFLILGAILVAGFAWYERSRPPSQVVALVAALAAMAIAGRVAFAAFPNVKPTTDIVVFAGYALGPAPGFAVGALTALVSNFWFGQGPWTPWQMAGWGMCGAMGALLALGTRNAGRFTLAALCGFAGIAYGLLLNFSLMATYGGDLSIQRFAALEARAVPFDAAHVAGNVAFALLAGPAMVRMLVRFRRRFEWRSPALAASALSVLVLLALPALLPASASAAAAGHALDWLEREQNDDGGFGASPGDPSSVPVTGWAMLGLEAAGRNPFDVSRAGHTPIDYLRSNLDEVTSSGDLARTIVALEGAGADPRSFGGRNLVAALLERRAANGSFQGWPGTTAYAVIALRTAGATGGLDGTLAWLAKAQKGDGGWGDTPETPSNADVTAAVMQAMPDTEAARHGLSYLRKHQHADGGFAVGSAGGAVNSQSTGWAVQGMIAVGADPARIASHGNSALDYLAARQAGDGHYRYSASSDQTSVWVTSEVLVGVAGDSLPIPPPPRDEKQGTKIGAAETAAGTGGSPAAPGPRLPQGSPVAPGGGASGGTSPGVPLPKGVTPVPEGGGSVGSPAPEAESPGATASFAEPAAGDGASPWIAIGIGAACTALAIAAAWLLGRRFDW